MSDIARELQDEPFANLARAIRDLQDVKTLRAVGACLYRLIKNSKSPYDLMDRAANAVGILESGEMLGEAGDAKGKRLEEE